MDDEPNTRADSLAILQKHLFKVRIAAVSQCNLFAVGTHITVYTPQILCFCDLKQNGTPFGWKFGNPKTWTFVSLARKEDHSVRNPV